MEDQGPPQVEPAAAQAQLPPKLPRAQAKDTKHESFFVIDEREDGFADDPPEDLLTWRGDPCQTLSDWTVVITNTDSDTVQTYHVHRAILGVGARKSDYFETLFRGSDTMLEKQSCTSKISFDIPGAADAFPVMLDFMYGGWDWIVAASDGNAVGNAVALRYLANYFRCRALMMEVNRIIERELDEKTCIMYLLEANKFGDDRLVASSEIACAKLCWKVHSDVFGQLPPELFNDIVHSEHLSCEPYHLSLVVSRYLDNNPGVVNSTLLIQLTDEDVMPCIGVDAATSLLGHIGSTIDTEGDQGTVEQLVRLSYRCSKSLSTKCWRSLEPMNMVRTYFANYPSNFGATVTQMTNLAAGLECAQTEYHRLQAQHLTLQRDAGEFNRRIRELQSRLDQMEGVHGKNEWPYYGTSRGTSKRGGGGSNGSGSS